MTPLALTQRGGRLQRRLLARQYLANQQRDQGVGQQNWQAKVLQGVERHCGRQGQHQQQHAQVDRQADQQQALGRERQPAPTPAAMEIQAPERRGEDHQHAHIDADTAQVDAVQKRHGGGNSDGQRAKIQATQADHHRATIKDQPRPQRQRMQHADQCGGAKQHALHNSLPTWRFFGLAHEARDQAHGHQHGQVEEEFDCACNHISF